MEVRLEERLSSLQRLSALEKRLEDLEWQRNADKVERSRYLKPGATETRHLLIYCLKRDSRRANVQTEAFKEY